MTLASKLALFRVHEMWTCTLSKPSFRRRPRCKFHLDVVHHSNAAWYNSCLFLVIRIAASCPYDADAQIPVVAVMPTRMVDHRWALLGSPLALRPLRVAMFYRAQRWLNSNVCDRDRVSSIALFRSGAESKVALFPWNNAFLIKTRYGISRVIGKCLSPSVPLRENMRPANKLVISAAGLSDCHSVACGSSSDEARASHGTSGRNSFHLASN